MQKLSKRKFEKKLDAKLEKLESKTKKIMEKKSHGLFHQMYQPRWQPTNMKREERLMFLGNASNTASSSKEVVMDALPADEYSFTPHVSKGEIVTQSWKVVNNGHLPWTDEVT